MMMSKVHRQFSRPDGKILVAGTNVQYCGVFVLNSDPFYIRLPEFAPGRPEPRQGAKPHLDPQPRDPGGRYISHEGNEEFFQLFEASVKGVQSKFTHLSEADIAAPPHRWFDAAFARQIALYVLVKEFDVPKNRIVSELQRSKQAVKRAMDAVEERLLTAEFTESYQEIVAQTEAELGGGSDG